MAAKRKRRGDADAATARLRKRFIDQIRAHGRVHHRSLLGAMRRHLETPATETAQDLAMLMRRKLRLLPQRVKDIASVRKALKAAPDPPEDPR
ncbi:MAG TPA: hypothetical protein VMZ92_06570 [Planctomycetota bacterium]|nr:hypothetical protein [Planctomycetota bacterium]